MPALFQLSRLATLMSLIAVTLVVGASAAQAAFPGANGRLAYVNSQGDLYTARYDGSNPTLLTTGVSGPRSTGPRWSPDGTKIAFSRNPGIWIINADGTNQHRIRATGLYPAWSPDGTKIVFAESVPVGPPNGNKERLHVMNVDGTGVVLLPTQPSTQYGDGSLIAPTWSPDGELIAYVQVSSAGNGLFVVQPDGTGRQEVFPIDGIAALGAPEWLPDSSRIAYSRFLVPGDMHLLTIRPDGTDEIVLGPTAYLQKPIAWSPDGTTFRHGETALGIVHSWQPIPSSAPNLALSKADSPDPAYLGETVDYSLRVTHVSGSQTATSAVVTDVVPSRLAVLSASSTQGTCSIAGQTVTCQLGSIAAGGSATVTIQTRVTQIGDVTNTASVQAAETDPDPINNSDSETTALPSATGYPRPKSATTVVVPLVPAFAQCSSANRTHGPPLASGSCHPPAQLSPYLTIGTADANGRATNSIGSERVKVLVGNPQTAADEADVQFSVSMTDVRSKPSLADYTGQLHVVHTLRITDRLNGDVLVAPATMRDYSMKFAVPCTATGSTSVGATCSTATTADALIPGAVKEGKRTLWELDQVSVFDGGSDDDVSTDDNVLFAKQGMFVP